MKKLYNWVKTNKVVSGVIGATFLLVVLNLVLIAEFVNILNTIYVD